MRHRDPTFWVGSSSKVYFGRFFFGGEGRPEISAVLNKVHGKHETANSMFDEICPLTSLMPSEADRSLCLAKGIHLCALAASGRVTRIYAYFFSNLQADSLRLFTITAM